MEISDDLLLLIDVCLVARNCLGDAAPPRVLKMGARDETKEAKVVRWNERSRRDGLRRI